MTKKTKEMTSREVAQKGGKATFKKYGKEHYRKIALDGWKKRRKAQKALEKAAAQASK